jgi:hypothetical protein
MAGQYRFKDINGNVVAQISSSADGTISFSGSAVDFSNASTITLGQVQLAGTASNALLLDGFDSTAFVFTSSFNTISQSISSQLNTLQTTSGSNIGRLNNLESKSSSVDISITNINSVTASNIARLSNLETKSASVDISVSSINTFTSSNGNASLNTFTASNNITSLNSKTGSYATTGSNTFFGTQTYSGSVYIANDLIVQGSSSIQYISASSVSIGTNIVQLNTANPSVRFAGLTIIDSGSIGGSGSFLYDSVQDEFVFVHRGNGTNVTSSHFVLGPETYDSLGNETYLTCNVLSKGTGKEHLVDSCIFDNGTTTCIKNNLVGTGVACFGGTVCVPSMGINYTPQGTGNLSLYKNTGPAIYLYDDAFYSSIKTVVTNGTQNNLVFGTQGGVTALTLKYDQSACFAGTVFAPSAIFSKAADQVVRVETTSATDNSRIDFITPSKCYTIQNLQTCAANALIFYDLSASAERMRITNCGNVGIGINPTSTFFQVSGNSPDNIAWFNNTQSNGYASARFYNNCNKAAVFGVGGSAVGAPYANNGYIYTDSGVDLAFAMGGTERMRITSTGIACFACQVCVKEAVYVYGSFPGVKLDRAGTTAQSDINWKDAGTSVWSIGTAVQAIGSNLDFYNYTLGGNVLKLTTTGEACFKYTVCAPQFISGAGTVTNPYGSWTTLFTIPSGQIAVYIAHAVLYGQGGYYTSTVMLGVNAATVSINHISNAGGACIRVDGYNVQVSNGSGFQQEINYKYFRMG